MKIFDLTNPWLVALIILIAIWDTIWKMVALWKSARNKHLAWFIFLAIFNTVGILPIIYIFFRKPEKTTPVSNEQ